MRRRDFIKVIVGSTVAFPLAARAQQPSLPVIGFLSSASRDEYAIRLRAFRQLLQVRFDQIVKPNGRDVLWSF